MSQCQIVSKDRIVYLCPIFSFKCVPDNRACKFNRENVGATCNDFRMIPRGNENALKHAVATVGPIAVAIDASKPTFRHYTSGIYDDPSTSSTKLDHAVLVVGYGIEDGQDYWLVKNRYKEKNNF